MIDDDSNVDAKQGSEAFSGKVHEVLAREVPTEGEMPLIYIGSGGDLATAMRVSSTQTFYLVDGARFMTRQRRGNAEYGSVDELKGAVATVGNRVHAELGSFAADTFRFGDDVSPGHDILASIVELGVDPAEVNIKTHRDGSASVRFTLNGRAHTVEYVCSKIDTGGGLKYFLPMVLDIRNGYYGLMTKAGYDLAVEVTGFAQWATETNSEIAPTYIVSDDPTSALSAQRQSASGDVAELYPGYQVHKVTDPSSQTTWGYTEGQGARAVVCVKQH